MADRFSRCFPPVSGGRSRILILGSLPGVESLRCQQYYAQPRNVFWDIMDALFGASRKLAYTERLERLRTHAVALWDVVAAGQRPGSLDASIRRSTVAVNDFDAFFQAEGRVELVCFNGRTAEDLYRRRVLPALQPKSASIPRQVLPSTSPAYAAMPFERKLEIWTAALGGYSA